jgi:xanthine dehydrogenase small subunit
MTVLEYLRNVAQRTGTKEGCAEGDCGACTVVLGELAPDGRRVVYRAINSCIRFLPTIDGHELVTVESLSDPGGALHPVQQAMVDQHASQCGFCTPGFVMSLFALYLNSDAPTREQVLETVSGNLCRCTGYRPIIEAGCRMSGYPAPQSWDRSAPTSSLRCQQLRSIRRDTALRTKDFRAPRTVAELAEVFESEPTALLLAGGTDIGLWVTKQLRDLPTVLYIGEIAELKTVRRDKNAITIGAAVSLAEGWSALVAEYPQLAEMAERFGSTPVRNSGTLCGNLANGSPIGDSIPVLLALGAELELRCGKRLRRLPLERFYLGYRRNALAAGEFVVAVIVPRLAKEHWLASYKVSKRFEQDISAVATGFTVCVENGQVTAARLAFGGMAAVAARAPITERALIGSAWSLQSIDTAASHLAQDFQPLTDFRASGAYRLQAAVNLLRRFYFEYADTTVATRTADVTSLAADLASSDAD